MKARTAFFVSGNTGVTAETFGQSLIVQAYAANYPLTEYVELKL